jgi:YegS/Rv2252/BmrU family lipid kinase
MNQPWVAIQRNPTSGTGARRGLLLELVRELRRRGITPRMFANRERMQARVNDPKSREHLICVVAAGGDGTVGDVVNRYPELPIATLPLGTENLLAKYLKIQPSGAQVAELIAQGLRRRLDLGQLNDRRFTLMASCGFDAAVVHQTHARRRGNIRKWHYLSPIWHAARNYAHPPLRIFVNDETQPRTARLLMAVNLPAYALGIPFAPWASGSDGQLDLCLFEQGSTFQMLRYLRHVVAGSHTKLPDVRCLKAARVRIEADVAAPWQMDGDPAGFTPVTLNVMPAALEIFAPT